MNLSKLQELVVNYYKENPGAGRKDCARDILGKDDYFAMCTLAGVENRLRKKGFLFFTTGSNQEVIDVADEDVPESKKMKVHKRMNSLSIGILATDLEIIKSAKTPLLIEAASSQLQELDQLLVGARNYLYANFRGPSKRIEARPKTATKALDKGKS